MGSAVKIMVKFLCVQDGSSDRRRVNQIRCNVPDIPIADYKCNDSGNSVYNAAPRQNETAPGRDMAAYSPPWPSKLDAVDHHKLKTGKRLEGQWVEVGRIGLIVHQIGVDLIWQIRWKVQWKKKWSKQMFLLTHSQFIVKIKGFFWKP